MQEPHKPDTQARGMLTPTESDTRKSKSPGLAAATTSFPEGVLINRTAISPGARSYEPGSGAVVEHVKRGLDRDERRVVGREGIGRKAGMIEMRNEWLNE